MIQYYDRYFPKGVGSTTPPSTVDGKKLKPFKIQVVEFFQRFGTSFALHRVGVLFYRKLTNEVRNILERQFLE